MMSVNKRMYELEITYQSLQEELWTGHLLFFGDVSNEGLSHQLQVPSSSFYTVAKFSDFLETMEKNFSSF